MDSDDIDGGTWGSGVSASDRDQRSTQPLLPFGGMGGTTTEEVERGRSCYGTRAEQVILLQHPLVSPVSVQVRRLDDAQISHTARGETCNTPTPRSQRTARLDRIFPRAFVTVAALADLS
ncbi:hypothetical protein DACRYDRAFT_114533 [Dacryopinax primogenitus]|uniref:Uncharacterized protein n=1 Tax=Dacryopinax primogenitus (strain DJM 731) TaxID=1858805 RepID=M5GCY7_DACPD|nr:uncharacterized protein DACRYDRAFT_114533 [Dacryopinax primogenitus]EJU04132.1 hypothetical protein DACRYDRAFT_114533 [Dacryopinax primogenitus]